MFVGRETELRKLNQRYRGNGLEFAVIYGRRRVGKTALINEFTKDKDTVFFPALRAGKKENLEALSKVLHLFEHPDAAESPVYPSFDAVFSELTVIAEKQRIIFVIDEFPYLAEADPSIASRLQHLLDHEWKDTGMFLILCGSSMSFMEKEVLSKNSPLFGRRTVQFLLQPLTYLTAAKLLPSASPEENALIFGITGGIAHYVNKLEYEGSLREALLDHFFDPSAYLFEEPENLLKQELREPAVYNSIISVVAAGNTKLSDIAAKSGMEQAACLKYIRVLTELRIIEKVEPVVDKSARKKEYRVCDPFFRFWYRFVPRNILAITTGTISRQYNAVIGSYLSQYMGLTFELICRQYLMYYAADLPFEISEIGEWWGSHPIMKKEIQIDLVAVGARENNSQDGRKFLFGSCKYKNEKTDRRELELLQEYASVFTTSRDQCFYWLFSKSGFSEDLTEDKKAGKVRLITLEQIYSPGYLGNENAGIRK